MAPVAPRRTGRLIRGIHDCVGNILCKSHTITGPIAPPRKNQFMELIHQIVDNYLHTYRGTGDYSGCLKDMKKLLHDGLVVSIPSKLSSKFITAVFSNFSAEMINDYVQAWGLQISIINKKLGKNSIEVTSVQNMLVVLNVSVNVYALSPAVMMLIGSVKIKAIALAKRSPHHGIWTWLFKKMQRIREIASVTRSNALNHHEVLYEYPPFPCMKLGIFHIFPYILQVDNKDNP
uniref:Uncharacterized protein n=1 Tax=Solanum lycopersicum TaxID=4081 RepID=A0A3Q7ESX4_SOLLC